ncbi:hypothetical protein [Variovorax sp. OV329]|uniref:hypothetical protein n=1 Tax=Variovorax sp. OV329 TaxID=1882825 RepID=UPI0008E24DA0|nr:hypothetical protein [Variovorax sp. OV329]SFM68339.1 hypothetical protein SAMN05444747_107303 [Variovorax sp. OV329]
MRTPTPKGSPPDGPVNEEPEITQEESVPSDGRDKVGEEMMKDLGRKKAEQDKESGEPGGPGPS